MLFSGRPISQFGVILVFVLEMLRSLAALFDLVPGWRENGSCLPQSHALNPSTLVKLF